MSSRPCKADQGNDGRKKLYIIDGDLDLLLGRPKPRLRHLHRLRRYCVENYLLEEGALVLAATILNPRLEIGILRQERDYPEWLDRNRDSLLGLFVFYAVAFELKREEQTVRYSVFKLLNHGDGEYGLCRESVFRRVLGLYRTVRMDCTKEEAREIYQRVRTNANHGGAERFVSAKDYILPLVFLRLKAKFRVNIPLNSFKALVAQCMEGPLDPYLLRRLRQVVR